MYFEAVDEMWCFGVLMRAVFVCVLSDPRRRLRRRVLTTGKHQDVERKESVLLSRQTGGSSNAWWSVGGGKLHGWQKHTHFVAQEACVVDISRVAGRSGYAAVLAAVPCLFVCCVE